MDMPSAIKAMIERRNLTTDEMTSVMRTIMTGEATQAQIGGFLIGLSMKGETVDEIAAAAAVMRDLSARVTVNATPLVDTCGTGGDGSNTFNISTTSAFVVAAAGAFVAKHGNRSISSKSGSADVLESAGVNLQLSPQQVAECIEKIGVGFMFAPAHHSAMKHAIGPRKEMGVRTIFNMLGPLTNPAAAPNQVMGVFAQHLLEPFANVLAKLGSRHVMVVRSDDGMDEISISAATQVAELKDGKIRRYSITPEQFGIARHDIAELAVDSVEQSLKIMRAVLSGQSGPASDIVALNAGAAIYTAGLVKDLEAGVQRAQEIIDCGDGRAKLDALVALTQSFK